MVRVEFDDISYVKYGFAYFHFFKEELHPKPKFCIFYALAYLKIIVTVPENDDYLKANCLRNSNQK